MKKVPEILTLEEIKKEDIPSVGGKGASLGEMFGIGLPVPRAFVVTAQAFRRFLGETGIEDRLFLGLANLNVEDNAALEAASQRAKDLVLSVSIPQHLQKKIRDAYGELGSEPVVAVRSSATAEDLPDASFAGQQETYLNIQGNGDLLHSIQRCWASLYGARAIYYRAKQGFDDRSVNIAVVVQELVDAKKAGVMFTSHPVTGEPLTIIEGSWGLGEAVVSGSVSPDKYVFDHRSGQVVDRLISAKLEMVVPDGKKGTKTIEVPGTMQKSPVLTDAEVKELGRFGAIAEGHYGVPQDLEWAISGKDFFILQSRPITTIRAPVQGKHAAAAATAGKVLVEGQGASPGIGS